MPPFSRLPTSRSTPRAAVPALTPERQATADRASTDQGLPRTAAPADRPLAIEPLSAAAFAPYGAMLGQPYDANAPTPAFTNANTDFWHQHAFDTGRGGRTEVLGVNYRRCDGRIDTLEVHHLTQQAIVPLGSVGVIHVVACSDAQGAPDLTTLRAFEIPPGQGICMQPGCWHATQVEADEATCLMLTRDSTTVELVAHMQHGAPAQESAFQRLPHAYLLSR